MKEGAIKRQEEKLRHVTTWAKHRFAETYDGEPGLHYLCEGYRRFFLHILKYLKAMTTLLENGLPASYVMDAAKGPLVIKRYYE